MRRNASLYRRVKLAAAREVTWWKWSKARQERARAREEFATIDLAAEASWRGLVSHCNTALRRKAFWRIVGTRPGYPIADPVADPGARDEVPAQSEADTVRADSFGNWLQGAVSD